MKDDDFKKSMDRAAVELYDYGRPAEKGAFKSGCAWAREYCAKEIERIDVKYDSEKLAEESEQFLYKFRERMKDIVKETFGEAYVNVMPYLETDTWTNYREALRTELEHEYMYSKFKEEWATNFRRAVFVENREEISKYISEDILKRIKEFEDRHQEYDCFRYSPGGDRYQDKVNENAELRATCLGLAAALSHCRAMWMAGVYNDRFIDKTLAAYETQLKRLRENK